VVGIFPNEAVIVRLIGAVLVEANDERQLQHRYMQTLPATESATPLIDATPTQISTTAADTAPRHPGRPAGAEIGHADRWGPLDRATAIA